MRLIAALLVAALAIGCGEGEPPPFRQVFADAGAPLWTAAILESEREVASWDLAAMESWQVSGASSRRSALGLVLGVEGPPTAGTASLVAEVDLDADLIETLELKVEAAPALGRVELNWDYTLDGLSGEGRIDLDFGLLSGDSLRAPVAHHAEWRGKVTRLEWRFSRIPDGQRLLVRGLRALETVPDVNALAEALSKSWRVDIDREVRPAILTLPDLERRLTVQVPPGGIFRVALGATAPRGTTEFVLRLENQGDKDQEGAHELWRVELDREELASWHPMEADLSPWEGREVSLELLTRAPAWKNGEGLPAWGGPELVGGPSPKRPDLVLISADTLRADHLSLYGYSRSTSPHLDDWARRRAVVFKKAVAPSPWTLPSHVSMLSGLDPLSHGVNYGLPASRRFEFLAERLRAAGYVTYAETDGGYLHPSYGLGQGFDVFRYSASKVPGPRDVATAVERAMAFADAQRAPVFLFVHTYETHEPYSARVEQLSRLLAEASSSESLASESLASDSRTWVTQWVPPRVDEGYAHRRRFVDAQTGLAIDDHSLVKDIYDSRVANLDAQLETLFSWLESRRPTALLFTSDHGESLGEDDRGGHASLDPQLLHIPLVLGLPGGADGGMEIEARVRLYDVMPTLLELAGVDVPEGLDGRSLLDMLSSPTPREAWAASPSTNAGIAFDADDEWRFRWQMAAWTTGGLARFDALGDEAEEPGLSGPTRRVLKRLSEAASGLEILIDNGGDKELVLDFTGSAVQNHRVKSLDGAPTALEWRGQTMGARLRLEPGQKRRLLLQTLRRGDLEIHEIHESEPLVHLDLGQDRLPIVLEPTTSGWFRSAKESAPDSGIRLRWVGAAPESSEDVGVDGELQRQLRALGYTG